MMTAIIVVYLLILIGIGRASVRFGISSAEDYFLARRSFGTVVLFMALFGTNVTAFALVGFPGLAYHAGVGVFGFLGASTAFVTPLGLILLGYPIWKFGKQYGYVTPSQMFKDRYQSSALGYLLFVLLLFYTILYIIIGVMGGGIAIEYISNREVSYSVGAAVVMAITVIYTSVGGMRGTAWTNCFQASVFLLFLVVACVVIAGQLGGPTHLHHRLVSEAPHLLGKEHWSLQPGFWATGILVGPASVIAFPHMFMRILAARDVRALRGTVYLYPFALMLLFIPVTFIGVWGALEFPGLEGKASDIILPRLMGTYLPTWLGAVGLVAILAAVMSSLDAQLLSVSTMLTIDILGRKKHISRSTFGKFFVVVVALLAYIVALGQPEAIYNMAVYVFSGYTLIVPVMAAAFFWRRSTAAGILAGTIVGHGLLFIYYLPINWIPKLPQFGWFPVMTCLLVETLVLVIVSLRTATPSLNALDRFSNPFGNTDRKSETMRTRIP